METKITKTYVLYTGAGVDRQPLCSDEDLDVVRAHKVDAIRDAFRRGMARPELSITCRDTAHPIGKHGELLVAGSTCDEYDVDHLTGERVVDYAQNQIDPLTGRALADMLTNRAASADVYPRTYPRTADQLAADAANARLAAERGNAA